MMFVQFCLTFLICMSWLINVHSSPIGSSCGYESCPAIVPGMLNVHLICHTHDDVGWLKTVDQYYYGAKSKIQRAGVQYILTSVVDELVKDPSKRFIYVETAFFWRWWEEQDDAMKATVRQLVDNGQLEFVGGGWSMNDEACAHYNAIIDQMTHGFRKLQDIFGSCGRPRVAWQIDPFGHSKEQASLFAQMGFDGLFFGRLDYADKDRRKNDTEMEMVWESNPSLGDLSRLFTGALYNNYGPPPGFCFDVTCNDDPIMDDPRLADYNVIAKVETFMRYIEEQEKHFMTDHIILTMGEDFNYQSAAMWYSNLDKLIRYVNARQLNGSRVNLLYSTPSCYLKALYDSGNTWPAKADDFLPYASDPHAYWTGFYTSRPSQKGFIRQSNNLLQICKQLAAVSHLHPDDQSLLDVLRAAMAVNQHHDAVTGTEKQHVAYDYYSRLSQGWASCQEVMGEAYDKLMSNSSDSPPLDHQICPNLNISECSVSEKSDRFIVTVYNPLARPVTTIVTFPVTDVTYTVFDSSGNVLEAQLLPVPKQIQSIPGRKSSAIYDLSFNAAELPPVGYKSYYVAKQISKKTWLSSRHVLSKISSHYISNEDISVGFDGFSGLMNSVTMNGLSLPVNQTFLYYQGMAGDNNHFKDRASGAYIFRPNGTDTFPVASDDSQVTLEMFNGPLMQEVRQVFSPWVSQVIRLGQTSDAVQLQWLVGPIPITDGLGKEVVSRFSSNLETDGEFFTDSNGRQILKRRRNHRDTWKLNVTEPVSGNFYPVNSRIGVSSSSDGVQFTVLTDRTQGGSSIRDGEVELMVHRRLLHDDAFGVGEALNETAFGRGLVVRGKHWLALSPLSIGTRIHRDLAQRIFMAPWLTFSPISASVDQWKSSYVTEFSALQAELPENLHLTTLEQWDDKRLLLRLEHTFEVGDDPVLSEPVTVQLKNLFSPFDITSAEEMNLGANQPKSEMNRFSWDVRGTAHQKLSRSDNEIPPYYPADTLAVTLKPMEIRTFLIQVNWK